MAKGVLGQSIGDHWHLGAGQVMTLIWGDWALIVGGSLALAGNLWISELSMGWRKRKLLRIGHGPVRT